MCLTAHAIFFPKFWNDKTNFTRVFVTVSPRRPWDQGWTSTAEENEKLHKSEETENESYDGENFTDESDDEEMQEDTKEETSESEKEEEMQ